MNFFTDVIGKGITNIWNKLTGSGYTDAQQASQDYQTEMSNTAFQRQVADMRAAGLNPALLYKSAGSGASVPSGPDVSGNGDPSQIFQIAMLGKQMKLLDAQAANQLASAHMTERNAAWIDQLNEAQLHKIASDIGVNEANINAMEYDNALKAAQTLIQQKEYAWFDKKTQAEIGNLDASAAKNFAEAAISQMELKLGHRLTSSELLALVDTIAASIPRLRNSPAAQAISGAARTAVRKAGDAFRSVRDAVRDTGRRLGQRFRRARP